MADTKISALTELAGASVTTADDVLPIVDTSVTTTKKITVDGLKTAMGVQAATTTASGMVELLTQAEYDAGTDTSRVPTASLNRIALGTEVATTSGTEKEFTSIPAGTRKIVLLLDGVSTNGSSNLLVQIGDSGGYETTNYTSNSSTDGGTRALSTAGFVITAVNSASYAPTGVVRLYLANSSHKWISDHQIGDQPNAGQELGGGSGRKTLSAELDRIRLTTVNGTDTFDAGTVNIQFER